MLFVLVTAGCGKNTGTITGVVTVGGTPLPTGWIAFHSQGETGQSVESAIKDGRYTIRDIIAGPVKITVRTYDVAAIPAVKVPQGVPPMPADQIKGKQTGPPGKFIPISSKYRNAKTSPLDYSVKSGEQEHNIDLKPAENTT
jgi:hypothetical protein